ncbi:MAG: hypothetical protein GX260_06350 [Tissierellia bacterium]|nr:hypothetical protein [Tissierellia bacterium]
MIKLIKRALKVNWKEMLPLLHQMHKESGRGYLDLFFDMYTLYKEEGYTWLNYPTFGFHLNKDREYRRSFLSEYIDNEIIRDQCVNPAAEDLLEDKGIFNKFFSEFIGREAIDLRWDSFEDFENMVQNREVLFLKTPFDHGGHNMERVATKDIKDVKALYDRLMKSGGYTIEEGVKQHPEMYKLAPKSINTIRTGTNVDRDGNVHVVYMVLRCSVSDNYMDNTSLGGIWTILNEDGLIVNPMFANLPTMKTYEKHPVTGFPFVGFQVPFIPELKEMVTKAALKISDCGCVGWDVAITENGPVIIEGNSIPSVELYQVYTQMPDGKGKVRMMEETLGIKLR